MASKTPTPASLLPWPLSSLRKYWWLPAGVAPTAQEWFGSVDAAAASDGSSYRELHPEGGPPSRSAPASASATEPSGNGHVCFVAELAPAKVIGDVRLVATGGDVVLGDLQALHGVQNPAEHWVCRRQRFRRPRSVPGTAVLLAAASGNNYFHWLFESLPRLHLLALTGWEIRNTECFLLNEALQPFHEQSLTRLGIAPRQRRRCGKGELLELERLVIPSMPAPPGVCPAWACDYLRRAFLPNSSVSPHRRIYVSRQGARGRQLENEAEIAALLVGRGFDVVCLDQLDFPEQVRLFAAATHIVAIHGAGLANLVFAPSGSSVLELFSPAYGIPCYQELAATRRLAYQSLTGRCGGRSVKRPELADLRIDPEELRRALGTMGL